MTDTLTPSRLAELCAAFRRQRVVVVGDVMLDHYLSGEVRRISPEAPVPVVEFHQETFQPGGAANVATNLRALGARTELVGVIGRDAFADHLKAGLRAAGISRRGLVVAPARTTTVKTRIVAHQSQLLRLDRETRQPLAASTRSALLRRLRAVTRGAVAIVVADYAKGVIDQPTLAGILALGRAKNIPVCIDPKPPRLLKFDSCSLLTPNRRETFELAGMADEAVGVNPTRHRNLQRAMARIRQKYRPDVLLVTLGESGMLLQEGDDAPRHLPTAARAVYDVSGAGDTVIAAFVLARAAGATTLEAATLANFAAGVVVGKFGVATVNPAELSRWACR